MSDIPTTVKNKALVEKRREQIVLAAIKLFAQKGFHETTLRELTEEAGVSYGNIYDYVGSKNDILFLIHEYLSNLAFTELDRAVENVDDPLEKLRRMVRAEFNLMDKWADGILLLYQEGRILKKPFLQKFLKKEGDHVNRFKIAVEECIQKGLLRPCNARLAANLIKTMVDCWVLKRWDLQGHATHREAEKSILEMVFYGLLKVKNAAPGALLEIDFLKAKKALVVNGGTVLGSAICSSLSAKGVQVCSYVDMDSNQEGNVPGIKNDLPPDIALYSSREHGRMNSELFLRIEKEFGSIDIYIHDLGIGNTVNTAQSSRRGISPGAGQRMDRNICSAHDVAPALQKEMIKRSFGYIIYITPWAWDMYAEPFRYQTMQAGILALSKAMAKAVAPYHINVNSIVPGFIKTAGLEEVKGGMPSGRLSDISDITDAIIFLAGDESKYLTNQVLKVNENLN